MRCCREAEGTLDTSKPILYCVLRDNYRRIELIWTTFEGVSVKPTQGYVKRKMGKGC